MNQAEAKEIINAMNRHKSVKDVHLEVIGQLARMALVTTNVELHDVMAEEIAQTLVSVRRLIELTNCRDEVNNHVETILERYRGGAL